MKDRHTSKDRESLGRLLDWIDPVVAWNVEIPKVTGDDQDIVTAASALLRSAVIQARAVHTLHGGPAREAAGANCRSLLEAFAELHWLLRRGDRLRNARKMFIFAHFELVDQSKGDPDFAVELQQTQLDMARIKGVDSTAYAEVEQQIAKGAKYWMGIGRLEMIRAAFEWIHDHDPKRGRELAAQGYKLFSWEDHHVTAILSVIDLSRGAAGHPTIQLVRGPEGPDDFNSGFAAAVLASCWDLVSQAFPSAFVF